MSKRKQLDIAALDVITGAPEQTVKKLELKADGKAPSRAGKVQVSAFVAEETRKRLKLIAMQQDRSLNELLTEGFDMLFERYSET